MLGNQCYLQICVLLKILTYFSLFVDLLMTPSVAHIACGHGSSLHLHLRLLRPVAGSHSISWPGSVRTRRSATSRGRITVATWSSLRVTRNTSLRIARNRRLSTISSWSEATGWASGSVWIMSSRPWVKFYLDVRMETFAPIKRNAAHNI